MTRKFYTSYVHDSWNGEKIFDNSRVLIDVPKNNERQIPILLQEKLSKKINDRINGRFFLLHLLTFGRLIKICQTKT